MIQKIARLKKYVDASQFKPNIYNLYEDERKEDVIVLNFKTKSDKEFEFINAEIEKYDTKKNMEKYFFRKTSANSVSDFPTLFISNSDMKDNDGNISFNSKSLKKIPRIFTANIMINPKIKELQNAFQNEEVLNAINDLSKDDPKKLFIVTFNIDGKYIGESELYEKILDESARQVWSDYYTLKKKEIIKRDKQCSICNKNKDEIWGYVSTWNFYTAKTEYAPIAGGLNQKKSWKNYPVCSDCAKDLHVMKLLVDRHMRFKFCGFDYYLIPDFLKDDESNKEIMEIFTNKDSAIGKFTFGKKRESITDDEEDILSIVKETDNRVNYTMFFFKENNAEFKIMLTIEDVFPSQFKEIFDAKTKAENHKIYKDIKGLYEKNKLDDLKFHFEVIKEFFRIQSKIYGDHTKAFLEIIRSIFMRQKINYNYILHRIMDIIHRKFANNEFLQNTILKAMIFQNFLYVLELITNKIINYCEVEMDQKYADFFADHKNFFCNNERKAVFLEGVLCQNLLDIQYGERNATPFRKRLNGMKLNKKIIQRLLPEIIEKLEQYDKNYYRKLELLISELLLNSDLDKLSNDELSFYFVMGMNLNKKLKENREGEKND